MNISEIVADYLQSFPQDRPLLTRLIDQVEAKQKLQGRDNFNGHITAGAIVLSPDCSKILMIHHNLMGRLLQPGGHWDDGEIDTLHAAQREALEETGVLIAQYLPFNPAKPLVPIHIETHAIPDRPSKHEPAHYHHDFRYVFIAAGLELHHQASEVSKADWYSLDRPEVNELAIPLARLRSSGLTNNDDYIAQAH